MAGIILYQLHLSKYVSVTLLRAQILYNRVKNSKRTPSFTITSPLILILVINVTSYCLTITSKEFVAICV